MTEIDICPKETAAVIFNLLFYITSLSQTLSLGRIFYNNNNDNDDDDYYGGDGDDDEGFIACLRILHDTPLSLGRTSRVTKSKVKLGFIRPKYITYAVHARYNNSLVKR